MLSRAIGEHIYHPDGEHARLRNAIMSAKSSEDYYDDLAWLYGGTGLGYYLSRLRGRSTREARRVGLPQPVRRGPPNPPRKRERAQAVKPLNRRRFAASYLAINPGDIARRRASSMRPERVM